MTVAELRELAKSKDIKGYSTMKKAELLDALK
ncbi:MAG: Rho termination factor N-terminal domain-containing protein [Tenericutes bacterium]|nr:Rho termination factor N-terminal domain-containing protein [Mycoplasmatota bacterium]